MNSYRLLQSLFACALFFGCDKSDPSGTAATQSTAAPKDKAEPKSVAEGPGFEKACLADARKGFRTHLIHKGAPGNAPPQPPAELFRLVEYPSEAGALKAFVTTDPKDGRKHAAIVWITGGDCNSIGDVWSEDPEDNAQSASAYRNAGMVMMFPSLRGGNDNPGAREGFLGEVNDIVAAARFLKKLPYVDAQRVYLGGHSTGGTLALVCAEATDEFRAIFSFGPMKDADELRELLPELVPYDASNKYEVKLRSPGEWLDSIKRPTYVFEGARRGNIDDLRAMKKSNANPQVHFYEVKRATHFTILARVNRLIAERIAAEDDQYELRIHQEEVQRLFVD